tara:strand:+ start:30620 stop:31510 length:891 start_codon:yes stop_codon:yes gene_type:complete
MMSVKILLLGANGIVGTDIQKKLNKVYQVESYTHNELDITNSNLIESKIRELTPNLVINSAAYTNVEKAETDQIHCYEVNTNAVKNLAEICYLYNSTLIHLSTDYIYDGVRDYPYTEDDIGNPINIYGDSKNKADDYIQSCKCNSVILRTSWVYGDSGKNFVKSVLDRAKMNDELKIVCDQYGVPTSSNFLAEIIDKHLVKHCMKMSHNPYKNIFNICSSGYTTWFNFAEEIIKYASKFDPKYKIDVIPIQSDHYNTVAKRPSYTVLSNKKISTYFDINIQNWEYYLGFFLDSYIK